MEHKDFTQIGVFAATRGIQGELKVNPTTSHPDAYTGLKEIFVAGDGEIVKYSVKRFRPHQKQWLIKLVGVDSIEQAEELRSKALLIPDDEILPLGEDEFFIHDLIESQVYSTGGEYLGIVKNYFETGANGVCEVQQEKKTFLFPVTKETLIKIDSQEKKVIIELLPGLLDL